MQNYLEDLEGDSPANATRVNLAVGLFTRRHLSAWFMHRVTEGLSAGRLPAVLSFFVYWGYFYALA